MFGNKKRIELATIQKHKNNLLISYLNFLISIVLYHIFSDVRHAAKASII